MTTRTFIPQARRVREGFTLLEVLLSSAIGVLLMAALYVAVEVQLRHAQAGRDVVEQSTLARALLARIASDISPTLGPPLPIPSSSSSGGTQPAGDTSGAAAGAGATAGAGAAATSTVPTTKMISAQGDTTQLVIANSRVPRELNWALDPTTVEGLAAASDLRRITYWIAANGGIPLGLARQEIKAVTAEETTAPIGTGGVEELQCIIAEEVKTLAFSYFDGTAWQEMWDSTAPGADGTTPMGPPLGIAVVIGITRPGWDPGPDGLQNLKLYRHFVEIPTANGAPKQTIATEQ